MPVALRARCSHEAYGKAVKSDLRIKRIVAVLCLTLWGTALWAEPNDVEKEIADYDRQIHQSRELIKVKEQNRKHFEEELAKLQAALSESERRLHPLKMEAEKLKVAGEQAKKKLETALANPELVEAAKLEALHKEHQSIRAELSKVEGAAAVMGKEVESLKGRAEGLQQRRRMAELEAEVLNRGIVSLLMKKPVVVEGTGECVMHDEITPKACEEMAMLKAKQDAIEKGGTSIVKSLTEVSLNEVKKDEVRVETTARIRQLDILQAPSHVGEGELGKYVARIRAVVQSQAKDVALRKDRTSSQGDGEPSSKAITPSPAST